MRQSDSTNSKGKLAATNGEATVRQQHNSGVNALLRGTALASMLLAGAGIFAAMTPQASAGVFCLRDSNSYVGQMYLAGQTGNPWTISDRGCGSDYSPSNTAPFALIEASGRGQNPSSSATLLEIGKYSIFLDRNGSKTDHAVTMTAVTEGDGKQTVKISGLADGEISANSTDAINGSQLHKLTIDKVDALMWDGDANGGAGAYNARHGTSTSNKIVNVAAGDISDTSLDAINGGQLEAFGASVARYFGGTTAFKDGTWTAPTFTITNVTGTGVTSTEDHNTVTDAFNALDTSVVNVNTRVGTIETNVGVISRDALMWNDVAGAYSARHGTPTTDNRITHIANGLDTSDAVNVSQLSGVARALGGGAGMDGDGNIIAPSYEISGTTYDNVGGALAALDEAAGASGDALMWDNVAGAYNAKHGTSGSNRITNVANGKIQYGSLDAVNGGQMRGLGGNVADAFGGGASFSKGAWTDPTYTIRNITSTGFVGKGTEYHDVGGALGALDKSVGNVNTRVGNIEDDALMWDPSANGNKGAYSAAHGRYNSPSKITNLANASLSKDSTDAVTGNQLFETNTNVTNLTTNITNGKIGPVQRTGKGELSLIAEGGSAYRPGKAQVLTNVANGSIVDGSLDAVNGGQMRSLGGNIADAFGGGASFSYGQWKDPSYVIYAIERDGDRNKRTYDNVGGALGALDTSITNVNSRVGSIEHDIDDLTYDALMWDDRLSAYSAAHGVRNTRSKITNLANASLSKDSTDAVTGNQLFETNTNVTNLTTNITNGKIGPVQRTGKGELSLIAEGGSAARPGKAQVLTNVANGSIGYGSLDAVNGGQVYRLGNDIADAFGGGAAIINGGLKAPTYMITTIDRRGDEQTSEYHNVGDAFDALDESVNTRFGNIEKGLSDFSEDALMWDDRLGAYSAAHGKWDRPSRITNVADGRIGYDSLDAINGGQMRQFGGDIASAFGGGAGFSKGVWTAPTFTITNITAAGDPSQSTKYDNVGDALSGLNTSVTNVNTRVSSVENKVSNLNDNTLMWDPNADGGKGAYSASHGDSETNKITNVAKGDISAGSTDAVNGSQLYELHQSVGEATQHAVRYNTDGEGKRTNTVSLIGGDEDAPVLLDNVADGIDDDDAVNVGQLKASVADATQYVDGRVTYAIDESRSYTNQVAAQTLQQANAYTDFRYGELSREIGTVRKEARQAAAIGLAAASLRYDDRPGKWSTSIGGGAWRGEGAIAMGVGYTSPDGVFRGNLSAATTDGEWGVGGGISLTLN